MPAELKKKTTYLDDELAEWVEESSDELGISESKVIGILLESYAETRNYEKLIDFSFKKEIEGVE